MTMNTKVAFATDDGSNVNQHFGRLAGFVVVTIQDGVETERAFIPRPQQADLPGDRRHNHAALLDPMSDCEVLIAGGMGLPMARNIDEAGIRLTLTAETLIDSALASFLDGSLRHEADRAHQPRH